MIRVGIAAPSAVTRAGLETLLRAQPDIQIAGSGPDLASIAALPADVVIAELQTSDDDLVPEVPFGGPALVLLADDPRPDWIREALRAGARAVLRRRAGEAEILAAVAAAAAGLVVVEPQALEPVLGVAPVHRAPPAGESLTPREIEVLRMLAEGDGNKAIAWKLGISEHTVKFHVGSIMSKLHAGSRTEAVATGIRQGLIML